MNVITGIVEILIGILSYNESKSGYNTGGSPRKLYKVDRRASKKEFKKDHIALKRSAKLPMLELQTILLTYMMNEDDGTINSNEKSIILDNFKQYRNTVTKEDIKRVKRLLNEPISLKGIVSYVSLSALTKETVDRSIGLLEIINQETNNYTEIIESIKKEISNNSDYII